MDSTPSVCVCTCECMCLFVFVCEAQSSSLATGLAWQPLLHVQVPKLGFAKRSLNGAIGGKPGAPSENHTRLSVVIILTSTPRRVIYMQYIQGSVERFLV